MKPARNVLGEPLETCGDRPVTGFYRDGCCNTGREDLGAHVICARVTAEFLQFSLQKGNDLVTPGPGFPGLRPGDHWCLCASRFLQAHDEGCAPNVRLSSTHMRALDIVPLDVLEAHALTQAG